MSTTPIDNQVLGGELAPIPYPVDTAGNYPFNQGDLLWFDSSAKFVKALDSDAHAAYSVGVASDTSPLQVYSAKSYPDSIGVNRRGVYRFKTTPAETYAEGTALYIGADAQTITTVTGSYSVGVAKMAPGVASVTGAAGVYVEVEITPKYPVSLV